MSNINFFSKFPSTDELLLSGYRSELTECLRMQVSIAEGLSDEKELILIMKETLDQNYFALDNLSRHELFNFREYRSILNTIENLKFELMERGKVLLDLEDAMGVEKKREEDLVSKIRNLDFKVYGAKILQFPQK